MSAVASNMIIVLLKYAEIKMLRDQLDEIGQQADADVQRQADIARAQVIYSGLPALLILGQMSLQLAVGVMLLEVYLVNCVFLVG